MMTESYNDEDFYLHHPYPARRHHLQYVPLELLLRKNSTITTAIITMRSTHLI